MDRGMLLIIGDSHQKVVQANLIFAALNMTVFCGAYDHSIRGYTSSSDWPNKKNRCKKVNIPSGWEGGSEIQFS